MALTRVRAAQLAFAGLAVAVALAGYVQNLTGYLINDDEGSYLYAAWRISLGELPYRDFLTPQLPGFLMPGGALMRLTGADVWPARAAAVVATLAAGVFVALAAARTHGLVVGGLAAAFLWLTPDVYLDLRTFRSEPFMLAYMAFGILALAHAAVPASGGSAAVTPSRRWLVAAGVGMGLATLTKLFGALALAGAAAFLVQQALQSRRGWHAALADAAWLCVTAAMVVFAGLGVFVAAGAPLYESVLGHHLQQGADLPAASVAGKAFWFFVTYVRYHALLVCLAVAAGLLAARRGEPGGLVFAWQLPTALAFVVFSRELFPRHLVYLMPALCVLAAAALRELGQARTTAAGAAAGAVSGPAAGKALAWAVGVALVLPWYLLDRDIAWRSEDGTERLAAFIGAVTMDSDLVLSDNSELNFYARRATTYAAAALSAGAAGSGQITWNRLAAELASGPQSLPRLVLVDRTEVEGVQYGHLRFLRDLDDFEAWLAAGYRHEGHVTRRLGLPDRQVYEVYAPLTSPLPTLAEFRGGPRLIGARVVSPGPVTSGGSVEVDLAWAGHEAEPGLAVSVRLMEASSGRMLAQFDEALKTAEGRSVEAWRPGELAGARVRVPVGVEVPPGIHTVAVGVYRSTDLGLLEAVATVPVQAGFVHVGQVRIETRAPDAAALMRTTGAQPAGLELGPLTVTGTLGLPEEALAPGTEFEVGLVLAGLGMVPPGVVVSVGFGDGGVSRPLNVAAGDASATYITVPVVIPIDAAEGSLPLLVKLGIETGADPDFASQLAQVAVLAGPEPPLRVGDAAPAAIGRAVFAGNVELVGATVASLGGDDLGVALAWRAQTAVDRRYKVTVQLLDSSKTPVGQSDQEPANWTRPTSGWWPGEAVDDEHRLSLSGLPPGEYSVVVGLYDALGQRAKAAAGAGPVEDDLVVIYVLALGGGT